ncbi:glycosyltransferase [uncultured Paludibaculum sp.]|uniref:glycosyltransferase n=1 Tax=uncultured Paludibaculum sp. TaxID=1765020 RepID=UPI002AAC3079|nr:glycosyltransferase [uncultured Paludibaculum sp.]
MRVLLLTLTDDPFDPPGAGRFGGSHAFYFDVSRQFVRMGHDVTIVTRLNDSSKPRFQKLGPLCRVHRVEVGPPEEVDHHSLGCLSDNLVAGVRSLGFEHRFDVLQTSNWLSGIVGLAFVPCLADKHVHHLLSLGRVRLALGEERSPHDKARDESECSIFASADALVCVTNEEREALERFYPDVARDKVTIIPYGIDSDIFSPRPSDAYDYLRRSGGRFT